MDGATLSPDSNTRDHVEEREKTRNGEFWRVIEGSVDSRDSLDYCRRSAKVGRRELGLHLDGNPALEALFHGGETIWKPGLRVAPSEYRGLATPVEPRQLSKHQLQSAIPLRWLASPCRRQLSLPPRLFLLPPLAGCEGLARPGAPGRARSGKERGERAPCRRHRFPRCPSPCLCPKPSSPKGAVLFYGQVAGLARLDFAGLFNSLFPLTF